MRFLSIVILCLSSMATAYGSALAPEVEKKPIFLEAHGYYREDPYYWLRERENPQVRAYLDAENQYAQAKLQSFGVEKAALESEFKSRIPSHRKSAPYTYRGYKYWSESQREEEFPVYFRAPVSSEGLPLQSDCPKEVIINPNLLAQGYSYFDLGDHELGHEDELLAFSFDRVGRRQYEIKVIDRESETTLVQIPNTTGSFLWFGNDLYYTKQDEMTLRSFQVYRIAHLQGSGAQTLFGKPELIYEENDTTFSVDIEKSLDERTFYIHISSTMADEWRYFSLGDPAQSLKIVEPRQRGLEYTVKDGGESLFLLTNYAAPDFQIMEVDKKDPGLKNWKVVLGPAQGTFRKSLRVFRDFIVVFEKFNAQDSLVLIERSSHQKSRLTLPEEASVATPGVNPTYEAQEFFYRYESLTTPPSTYSLPRGRPFATLLHREEHIGYDPSLYESQRIWAPAQDGTLVPMSLVYKKGRLKDGKSPALIYGYGSYGMSVEPTFQSRRISLLDRGFVYVIAHVRGGSELGRSWYEQGKLFQKMNTFSDFIDCTRFLIAEGWTSPEHLYAQGASAGGLLMGAVANMAPELYRGMIAQVPFVDVVTTMLDESIPLTTSEYDEWGDPRIKGCYQYMFGYSPYDKVKPQSYPHMLVTSGFYDSQVQYWEPTKWVAKLRDFNQGDSMILLKTNMEAGHGGASGQLAELKEVAEEWSFILHLEKDQNSSTNSL